VQASKKDREKALDKDGAVLPDQAQELTVIDAANVTTTLAAVKALVEDADKYLTTMKETDPNYRVIATLKQQVDSYAKMALTSGRDRKWFPGVGPELHRFGAWIALLAAKIGQVPAVNCNWGRDRTGAMDNEIKMLALQLEQNPTAQIPEIRQEGDDPDVEMRTWMLKETGNCDLARQVNYTRNPINLNQSMGISGLIGLFDQQKLKD